MHCLNQCSTVEAQQENQSSNESRSKSNNEGANNTAEFTFIKELRGEVMLRIAILKKDVGAVDQSIVMCNNLCLEPNFSESIRANALCLKVLDWSFRIQSSLLQFFPLVFIFSSQGLLHEIKGEFPSSEVVYRSVLQLSPGKNKNHFLCLPLFLSVLY